MQKAKKLFVGSLVLFTLFWIGAGEVDQRTFVNITRPGSGKTQGKRAPSGEYTSIHVLLTSKTLRTG